MTMTRPDTRGVHSKDEVQERAEKAFRQIKGLRPWDRRRIIQRVERLNKEESTEQVA